MFTSNERGIRKQAQVDFTRSGWRQFFKLNRSLGARVVFTFCCIIGVRTSLSKFY